VRPEGLGKLEKIHFIGTRSRDLPVCNIVPQPLRYCVPQLKLLLPLKEGLGERRLLCDEDVKNAVYQRLRAQPKTFSYDAIKKLVVPWEKRVENQGDFIEKIMYIIFVIINKLKL
jgi:hypothetical protein